MLVIKTLFQFITWGVTAIAVAGIVLILLRSLINYMNLNPFSWLAVTLRRSTEPVLRPVRAVLIGFRVDPNFAPFLVIILLIVAGYMLVEFARSLLWTIAGVIYALTSGQLGMSVAVAGYVLFGLLELYTLAIFVRIIFLFVGVGYGNRLMRFLYRITEPLLAPLRRMVPPVGMFDLSPMVAIIIVWVCKAAVAGMLLKGWRMDFL
jgi:YggT family protein